MKLDVTAKKAFVALLSSSETSSDEDEDLCDLLIVLAQELRQQKRKFSRSSQRKRRIVEHKPSTPSYADENTNIHASRLEAATIAQRMPTTISEDRCENKSKALIGIKNEILVAYLENWQQINSEEFHKLFRIHKTSFWEILQGFEKFQQKNEKVLESIKHTKHSKMLLIFLLYAGHQISLKTLSYKIKIYCSTLTAYIDYLIDYLLSLVATKVRLPQSVSEKMDKAEEFYGIAGLKNVIGCIEKLNFRFAPHICSLNKNTNSFSVEVVCDARGRFLAQDTETLDSTLAQVCEKNYCFLASLKFSLREWTIIPCQGNDSKSQLHADQQLFNEKFLTTFAVMQTAVCQLQLRFRSLLCIDTHRLTFARRFLHACFGLHNILIECNDYWFDEENVESEDWQPLVVDAMMGMEIKSELDRFSCPRGLEKRERMIYETCVLGTVEEQQLVVE